MLNRTNISNPIKPFFLVDYHSYDQGVGCQISWADVPDSYKDASGNKFLPAGKIVVHLTTGANAGKAVPSDSVAVVGGDTDYTILISSANEKDYNDAASGYGTCVSGVLYENLLPDSSGNPKVLAPALKTKLVASGKYIFQTRAESRG
jgi:hypothetical protein